MYTTSNTTYHEMYEAYMESFRRTEREHQYTRAIVCSIPAREIGSSSVSLSAAISEDPG